jgi:D-3-phosphoglycerate dehydrogenase
MCYTPITSTIIQGAKNLKAIVKYGVGIDAIDIPAANERGIVVVNIPEYAEETVAEGAFSMLIALAKKLPSLQRQMNQHGWAWPTQEWLGLDLAEKKLGIIGCGKIGNSMARMAGLGFRMKVIGFDPNKSQEELARHGIEKREDLLDLLRDSDFISVHAVLNKDTKHLLGKEAFLAMKSTSILINTARGALVDEIALLKALENGQIAGAGLDVFSREPLNRLDHPLKKMYAMENVILLPHMTFYTQEAMERLELETLERISEVIDHKSITIKSKDPRLQNQRHLTKA